MILDWISRAIDWVPAGATFNLNINRRYHILYTIYIQTIVGYWFRNANSEDKEQAELCLKLISFGMANTFIKFKDQYWLYGGDKLVKEKGLTIGG